MDSSANQVIVTPNKDLTTVSSTTRYEAEYARLTGPAKVTCGSSTGYSGTSFSEGYGAGTHGHVADLDRIQVASALG